MVAGELQVGELGGHGGDGRGVVVLGPPRDGGEEARSRGVGLVLLRKVGEDLAGKLDPEPLVQLDEVAIASANKELQLALPLDTEEIVLG